MIKNSQKKSYYSSILKQQKNVITDFIFSTNSIYLRKPSASSTKMKALNSEYYENSLKKLYKDTLSEAINIDFSSNISPSIKESIE